MLLPWPAPTTSRWTTSSAPCAPGHDGFEWLYVLNGQLRLVLGDGNAVELLVLFGTHGERAHVRARA